MTTYGEFTFSPTGKPIRKFTDEEQLRSFDFAKWLGTSETLQNPTVTCLDEDDNDVSAGHVGSVQVSGSQVQFWLQSGQADGVYRLKIKTDTNLGQTLEGRVIYYNCT